MNTSDNMRQSTRSSVVTTVSFMVWALFCFSFDNPGTATLSEGKSDSVISVLVLIPYDEIANAGVSPDTRIVLESALAGKGRISVIPFPFRKLMGVPYQMVYDKKYCKPIIDKVECDVIIMTQLITDSEREPNAWQWAYNVRVLNVMTGKQRDSIRGMNLHVDEVAGDIMKKIDQLVEDIESSI